MRDRAAAGLALAAGLGPGTASAHSPIAGIEGFYSGLIHPLTTPGQILALVALGMLVGAVWPRRFGTAWVCFASALVFGSATGLAAGPPVGIESALLVAAALAATLAALAPAVPSPVQPSASLGIGALLGLASAPDPGPVAATLVTLAGSIIGANLALLYVGGGIGWLSERMDGLRTRGWGQAGLRVVAAWVAAVSILMAALVATGR